MTLLKNIIFMVTVSFSLIATNLWASGSTGFGNSRPPAPIRKVDENYEYGKALFQGRVTGIEKRAYCVQVDDEKLPLKRRTLKAYKAGSYLDFANALYYCDQPDLKIGNNLSKDHFGLVLYYLNKRFRLRLNDRVGS